MTIGVTVALAALAITLGLYEVTLVLRRIASALEAIERNRENHL